MQQIDNEYLIQNVSETSLITLYYRAYETGAKNPIINDPKAVEIVNQLSSYYDFSKYKRARNFKKSAVLMSLRIRRFDYYVNQFLAKNPDGIIINLGCGFDTRFYRMDNGKLEWFDLDLPEIIDIRKRFFTEQERYHFIASSVLDFEWMSLITNRQNPVLILAEGLFEYLYPNEVKNLVLKLQENFPASELVCEVVHSRWVKRMQKKGYYYKSYKKNQQFFRSNNGFRIGVS